MMMEESLAIAITPQMPRERIWAGNVSLSEDCSTSPAKCTSILERKKKRRVKINFHPWLHLKQSSGASANTRNEKTVAALYILICVTLLGISMKYEKNGKVMNWAATLISVSKKMFMLSWFSMKAGPYPRKKQKNIMRLSLRKSPRTEPYLKRSKTFKVQLCFLFWFYLYSSCREATSSSDSPWSLTSFRYAILIKAAKAASGLSLAISSRGGLSTQKIKASVTARQKGRKQQPITSFQSRNRQNTTQLTRLPTVNQN